MKAVICTKYGPPEVLRIQDVPKPTPKANEVLIRVRATTTHIGDTKIRRLEPGMGAIQDALFKPMMRVMLGFSGPRNPILGMELAGEIEAVGTKVSKFTVGDKVFGGTGMKFGAYAQYKCMPETGLLAVLPANVSYEQAAPVTNGGLTALLILEKASVQPGQKVLIYGASGSVGTYAVQIAKHLGADVTGVCSGANVDMVKSLGANQVVDYTCQDFTQAGPIYDVIFDTVGKIPKPLRKPALTPNGVYLNVLSTSNSIKLTTDALQTLRDMLANAQLKTVIDRRYPMDQIIDAHRYVDAGHKKGHVIVEVY